MFKLQFLLFCISFNCKIDAQLINEIYRSGLASYNLLNVATSGLTEVLTGASRLFNYDWRQPRIQQRNYYQQPQTNFQQQNYQLQTNYQQSSSCSSFFSYQIDQNEKFGVVTLPNPNYLKNELKIYLTVGVQLTSVRI